MWFTDNCKKLYLRGWRYNTGRILTELAKIIENNNGIVDYLQKSGIVEDRTNSDMIIETEKMINARENAFNNHPELGEDFKKATEKMREELETLRTAQPAQYQTFFLTYIKFKLNGIYYYFQFDENPFFEHIYTKARLNNNGTTYSEVYIENLNPETWLFDCLFKSDCSNADIIEVANLIYNQLVSAPLGESVSETIRKRVPNYYNNGYHYELIVKPGREITITF